MKTYRISCCLLALLCLTARAAGKGDVKQRVKAKVEEINRALIKEDFSRVADLTYKGVVKLAGGRDKMIAIMKTGMKEMKSKGYAIRSVKVGNPSDPVSEGGESYVVVPIQLEMKAPGGKIHQKGFVIGVSRDKGKTWTFVNGDLGKQKVKQILPNLPDKLKLPKKQKPEFEKD